MLFWFVPSCLGKIYGEKALIKAVQNTLGVRNTLNK